VAKLMRAWGKMPVRVRDVAGFIVNRVARPYYAEGFAALGEGVDPATVDAAMVEAGGFRMGPLALADMIGHDVNYAVAASVFDAGMGLPRFRLHEAQRSLVERRLFGRKSSKGVYDYTAPLPAPSYVDGSSARIEARLSDHGLLQPVVAAARAAGVAVRHDDRLPPETIELDGIRMALGDGRTLAERADIDILIDHARDFAVAKTVAITARAASHAGVAAGFFRAAERRTLMVPDRPGQLVLRTLAQLANAAADTIADQIASAEDVETAMLYGANHPEGPLSWARRLGCDRMRVMLRHIARATGDTLYEPSRLFGCD
jgi:3-hydroxybutyryl-CoA dehydrogenase